MSGVENRHISRNAARLTEVSVVEPAAQNAHPANTNQIGATSVALSTGSFWGCWNAIRTVTLSE